MVFNLQRLKLSIAANCFDLQGNYAVHAGCLVELLGVSPAYLASLHACVIDQKRAPIYQEPKGKLQHAYSSKSSSLRRIPAPVASAATSRASRRAPPSICVA